MRYIIKLQFCFTNWTFQIWAMSTGKTDGISHKLEATGLQWPTVSWPVCLGAENPSRINDQFLSLLEFFLDSCWFILQSPLWREDGSVTYSAIADWPGHWGPVTIHYRLIWDCVSFSSPLTTRRDCGGGILTHLYTGKSEIFLLYHVQEFSLYLTGITFSHPNPPPHGEEWDLFTISYIGIQFVPHRNHITSF
jgi:hypothetical protein